MPDRGDLDAVTVDALGTCVELRDPVPALRAALAERGVARDDAAVAAAFEREVAYYVPRSHEGRDEASLQALQRACAGVFLAELEVDLDAGEFAPAFVAALEFDAVPGAPEALERLRGAGLALACVSNWDITLPRFLADAGVAHLFATVVTSAEAGAPKPEPAIFAHALRRLAVPAARALHVGDSDADRLGALAAGLTFEPVPLVTLPARLGLR